jgi:predicted double-glycine peptidase
MRGRQVPRFRLGLALLLALTVLPAVSGAQSLTLLDVPFMAQSELLCGGAAAAMVMRYWGERGIDAETFQPLVDRKARGIRTDALTSDLRARGWNVLALDGSAEALEHELEQGRPVVALIEDHPGTDHFVVVVARSANGVIFHDPARAPFRVSTAAEFDKRWAVTKRWMLVVTPGAARNSVTISAPDRVVPSTPCDQQIADGVRLAQQNDLDASERTLAAAISCPGGAAFRELAGIRALQHRWPETAELASAALARDGSDDYAARLLATARFVTDDQLGALDAWNRIDEPRIDLIRVDGLTRTRYQVVEHALGLKPGTTLSRAALMRARRRLLEFPAGPGSVDFSPVSAGLAEIRATVGDRPLVPHGALDLGVLGVAASITREIATSISSPSGGGEQVGVDWRFWAHRPLYQVSFGAPAPWRGVWKLAASRERQPYTSAFAPTVHDAVQLELADWANGSIRWQAATGIDRWNRGANFGRVAGGVRFVSGSDRLDARAQLQTWFGGGGGFERADIRVLARSSSRPRGMVLVMDAGVVAVSASAPPDLWPAGDTGRARPLLLRAHPMLGEDERFRTERLGRLFTHASAEAQRWWAPGPVRAGVAAFVDTGRTDRRLLGQAITDVDVGVGLRGAYPGKTGALRLDLAHGLRDGRTALSVTYTSDIP